MATKTANIGADVLNQAVDTFDTALKAGVKMQQEMIDWWSELAGQASVTEYRDRVQDIAAEAVPIAQKNVEEQLKAFDQSCKNCLDLLKRGLETAQSDSVSDLQARTQELWEASLKTMRNNTEAIVQANTRAMTSFADLARKNVNGKPQPAAVRA